MGTIHLTKDLVNIIDSFKAIDFEVETPAGIALRYGKKASSNQGRIWKMTKSVSNTHGDFLHYASLKANGFKDGELVQIEEV